MRYLLPLIAFAIPTTSGQYAQVGSYCPDAGGVFSTALQYSGVNCSWEAPIFPGTDALGLSTGVYVYRVSAGGQVQNRAFVVNR